MAGQRLGVAAEIVATQWGKWHSRFPIVQAVASRYGVDPTVLVSIALIEGWARPGWFRFCEYLSVLIDRMSGLGRGAQTVGPLQLDRRILARYECPVVHSWRQALNVASTELSGVTDCDNRDTALIAGVTYGGTLEYAQLLSAVSDVVRERIGAVYKKDASVK